MILYVEISVVEDSRIGPQLVVYWLWGIRKHEGSQTGIIKARKPFSPGHNYKTLRKNFLQCVNDK